jgi:phage-related protein
MPEGVRDGFGYALYLAQIGGSHEHVKPLKGFGPGVLEAIEDSRGDTFRAIYAVRFDSGVYVLHCFQKKSKRGIATPKMDSDLIKARLKLAETHAKGLRHEGVRSEHRECIRRLGPP